MDCLLQINLDITDPESKLFYDYLSQHVSNMIPLAYLNVLLHITKLNSNSYKYSKNFFIKCANEIGFLKNPKFTISEFRQNHNGYLTVSLSDDGGYIQYIKSKFCQHFYTSKCMYQDEFSNDILLSRNKVDKNVLRLLNSQDFSKITLSFNKFLIRRRNYIVFKWTFMDIARCNIKFIYLSSYIDNPEVDILEASYNFNKMIMDNNGIEIELNNLENESVIYVPINNNNDNSHLIKMFNDLKTKYHSEYLFESNILFLSGLGQINFFVGLEKNSLKFKPQKIQITNFSLVLKTNSMTPFTDSTFNLKVITKKHAMHIFKKPNLLKSIFFSTMLDIGDQEYLSFEKIKDENVYIMTDNALTKNLIDRFCAYFPDSWNENQTIKKNYNISSMHMHLLKYPILQIPIDFNLTSLDVLPV